MDDEHSGPTRLGPPLRPLLTYGVPYIGAGVWAFTRFPEQLRWASDVFARVFGLAAPFYEDLTRVEGYGDALDAAIDALEREPIRVLDLCCGTGFAARQIQHAFPDAEVVGIDLSPEMVLMARREADEEGFDIEFEVDDARGLKLEDESFDLVVSHNAPPFPEETMRVLGPSGTALTVWSFGGPWVGLAWPALAKRLRKASALHADGFRAGPGFYAIAEKSGIRRRRPSRASGANGSAPPAARRASTGTRPSAPARTAQAPTAATRPAAPARTAQAPPAGKPALAKRPAAKASTAKASTAKPTARRPSPKQPANPPSSSSRGRGSRRSPTGTDRMESRPDTPS
ncbi:MAG TPA: class I SAM-dependent methyltransferase [Actinomycetota bacterium]